MEKENVVNKNPPIKFKMFHVCELYGCPKKEFIWATDDAAQAHRMAALYLNNYAQTPRHHHELYMGDQKITLSQLPPVDLETTRKRREKEYIPSPSELR